MLNNVRQLFFLWLLNGDDSDGNDDYDKGYHLSNTNTDTCSFKHLTYISLFSPYNNSMGVGTDVNLHFTEEETESHNLAKVS